MAKQGCGATIEAVWNRNIEAMACSRVIRKIQICGEALLKWSKTSFGSVKRELKEKRKLLSKAELATSRGGDINRVRVLEHEINLLMDREAQMWSQRSKIQWLKDGDRNTRYFHSKASQHRRQNYMKGVYNRQGRWCTDPSSMVDTVLEFYQGLFTSTNPTSFDDILEQIPQVVTEEMNSDLMGDFTAQEVEVALKQMAPLKSPRPDGMPPIFYQNYWSLVGSDVVDAILMNLNTGTFPPSLGHSFITLIPKVNNPEYISQCRPISLSNVLYRVYSKVLANRLKKLLPKIVSEQQSAFMTDRLISDNIMVVFETLHYMHNHSTRNNGYMALKLDMSKAYDRVEWLYMEKLMTKMGFCAAWVKLMMGCITTATYLVLINGEPYGNIVPTRGLRQGDPLSPYLFLLCTEGFHGLLKKAEDIGELRGVSISRNGPKLTHLLFVDDSLIFCRAQNNDCQKLLEILGIYERTSGQQINRDKTTLFFSKSTTPDMQESIKQAIGVPVVQQYEKYLGLPSFIGRKKKESFDNIKQKVWKKLQGWEGKLLSQAGREVLIKAVAQALPTYTMSCFKLPIGLCHEIKALIKKKFWG